MTHDPDIAAVAAGLSEIDRHFLLQLKRRGFSIHPGNQSRAVREFLHTAEKLGLLTNPSFDNYFMQPLGLAVKAHLERIDHA